jgi:hypothetical protein
MALFRIADGRHLADDLSRTGIASISSTSPARVPALRVLQPLSPGHHLLVKDRCGKSAAFYRLRPQRQ